MRPTLTGTDAEFCLFAAHRACAHSADAIAEAANFLEDGAAKGHVAADEIAHRGEIERHSPIGAAHHPVEFMGKPFGSPFMPERFNGTTHPQDIGVAIVGKHPFQPVGRGDGIFVHKGDNIAAGNAQPAVACARKPLLFVAFDDTNVGKLLLGTQKERWIVVNDQNQLVGWASLPLERLDCRQQLVPTFFGIGTEQNRYRHLFLGESGFSNGCLRDLCLSDSYFSDSYFRRLCVMHNIPTLRVSEPPDTDHLWHSQPFAVLERVPAISPRVGDEVFVAHWQSAAAPIR